jgi:hypothetical protein
MWFERGRRRCVDHLRALSSVQLAHEYISTLLTRWTSNEVHSLAGLHAASVIAYARPFTAAFTKEGKLKYPVSALRKTPGFDHELHSHLLDLRNNLIAHGDYDLLPSTMYLQTVGDEKLPVAMGVNVKCIVGIEARPLAERYQAHFRTCLTVIEEMLNRDLREIAARAQTHPEEFHATHNIPAAILEVKPTIELADFPGPVGAAGDVAEPSFSERLSGYKYLTVRHELALIESGTYSIHDRGVPIDVTFEVN